MREAVPIERNGSLYSPEAKQDKYSSTMCDVKVNFLWTAKKGVNMSSCVVFMPRSPEALTGLLVPHYSGGSVYLVQRFMNHRELQANVAIDLKISDVYDRVPAPLSISVVLGAGSPVHIS